MEIDTKFGTQEIDADSVITFPKGMLGFTGLKQYKLFHEEDKPNLFWLQAVDDAEVSFPVSLPASFNVDYQLTLSDEDLALLQLEDSADITILLTVSRQPDMDGPAQANFMGPVIINTRSRIGLQKTLTQMQRHVVITAE